MDGIRWEGTSFELDSERYEWKFRICEQIPGWNNGAYNRDTSAYDAPEREYKIMNVRSVIVTGNGIEKTFPSMVQAAVYLGMKNKTLAMGLIRHGKYEIGGYTIVYGSGKNYSPKIKCELIRGNEKYEYETLHKLIDGLHSKNAKISRFRVYKEFRECGKQEVCINGWTIRKVS